MTMQSDFKGYPYLAWKPLFPEPHEGDINEMFSERDGVHAEAVLLSRIEARRVELKQKDGKPRKALLSISAVPGYKGARDITVNVIFRVIDAEKMATYAAEQWQRGANAGAPQPAPVPNDSRPVWDMVIDDMRRRDQTGRQRYGTPLQAGNGRDALRDAYEEALDLCVYLRQAIEERGAVK
jgi:hypothetical protein